MIKVKIIKNAENSYCPIPTRNRKVNEANKAEAAEDPDKWKETFLEWAPSLNTVRVINI